MEEFLRKLQNSDQRTKMRVAIILTSACMAVVVIVWLFYFNTLVTSGVQKDQTADVQIGADEFSFWGSMKDGTALMIDNIKGTLGTIRGRFSATKRYDIQPNN